ncbi:MAG: CARDB domain-containing protein [Tepidisphaeraceae bacterium]
MVARHSLHRLIPLAIAAAMPFGCAPQPPKPSVIAAPPLTPAPAPAPKPAEAPKPAAMAPMDNVTTANGMVKGQLYFPTGDASTSALLLEKSIPVEVQSNRPFSYDIKVTNVAKLKLEGVEIAETVPGTFKIKDVTEGSPDGKPNTVTYLIGSLEPGDSKIVRLQGTATQSGALGMCLSAKYNTSLCMATTVVSPALRVTTIGPADAMYCDTLSYKITVTNTGSGQAKNVKVEAVLPEGLTVNDGRAAVAYDAGTLGAGESRDFAFTAKAAKNGNYVIKATASADEGLNSEAASIATAVHRPILQISKTGPEKAFIGQPIAYDISVTNKGDGVAKDTVVFDNLPQGVTVQAASENGRSDSNGKVRWNLGDLAPGATKKVTVVVTAAEAGDMKSAASVTAACAETQAAYAATTLAGVPAILVQTADNPDPVRVGDQTTYTIEVTNQGTAPGTNIKLVCTLEDPMSFVTASGETKDTVDGKTITFEPLGSLAPKAKAVYKVTVKAAKSGDVRFKTIITSDQLGRPVESTEATTFFGQ